MWFTTKLLKAFLFEPQRYKRKCCSLMATSFTVMSRQPVRILQPLPLRLVANLPSTPTYKITIDDN